MGGLTMRGVAARLGVAPNALYSHVAGKTDLVDLVLDDVLGGVPVPDDSAIAAAPTMAVRRVMQDSYDVLLAHADLMPTFLARQGARGDNAQRLGMVTLAALARAGVPDDVAGEALRVLIVNTIGFAALATDGGPLPEAELRANYARALDWLIAGILAEA
jgi:AcrR family transcriptional regulator